MTAAELLMAAGLGLAAGVLGGLAGIGGSMVMLPGLHAIFGGEPESIHHRYMAAAMTVNVAVALPAALRHHAHGAVRTDLLRMLLSGTMLAMVVGVLASNQFRGTALRLLLAMFIAGYCLMNLARLLRGRPEPLREHEQTTAPRLLVSGGATGLVGGLLGLGGGVLLVPFLQTLCRMPLRASIATSAAVICMTAVVGAGLKLGTLHTVGESARAALVLALMMAPTAIIGARAGARLTHALPLQTVRLAVTALLLVAAGKLAELW